jgi:hypothetical protein
MAPALKAAVDTLGAMVKFCSEADFAGMMD